MRTQRSIGIALASLVGLALAPSFGLAADAEVEAQLKQMNERLSQLEDRLQATNDELVSAQQTVRAQQQVMEDAGLEAGSESALSTFLESTEFSGWVASSYNFNFNREGDANRGLVGQNGNTPFFPDANTFQVDQVWFEIDKAVSEESRGGFHIDLLFGKHASALGGNGGGIGGGTDGNDGVELFTAYASYQIPWIEWRIDAGELPTLLGAEVVQTPYNFNITRGVVWGIQPVTHTGAILSGDLGDNLSVAAGFVNDVFTDTNQDSDNNKAFTAQMGFGDDGFSTAVSWIYGSGALDSTGVLRGSNDDRYQILDIVLTAEPVENISLWINADWASGWGLEGTVFGMSNVKVPDYDIIAVAAAVRWQFLEKTGFALRGEFLADFDGAYTGFNVRPKGGSPEIDKAGGEVYTLTATFDQQLTENLVARLEGRFDWTVLEGGSDRVFADSQGNIDSNSQQLVLAQILYSF